MRLKSRVVPVGALKRDERARMFSLMARYYDLVEEAQFQKDLDDKTSVIVLEDAGVIQGFSTLKISARSQGGRRYLAAYSGDTVVDRAYWGQRILGKAFLAELWRVKVRNLGVPLYWFLISKGYKTYLLMANNFSEYFPSPDRPTPDDKREMMTGFYQELFPDHYSAETGLIRFDRAPCRLKEGVAAISETLRQKQPKIAFFESVNPRWHEGDELACLARMTFWMPVKYAVKAALAPIGSRLPRLVPSSLGRATKPARLPSPGVAP